MLKIVTTIKPLVSWVPGILLISPVIPELTAAPGPLPQRTWSHGQVSDSCGLIS